MRIMSAIHPTQNQKRVLAIIAGSANAKVAGEQITGDANLVSARNLMMKLGLITFSNGEATLTDKGQQTAKEENITDDSGQLTDAGSQLVGGQAAAPQSQPPADQDDGMGMGDDIFGDDPSAAGGEQGDPFQESFSLLKELLYR